MESRSIPTGASSSPWGKQALFEATFTFVEAGIDVLIPEPAWVSYGPMVELAGVKLSSFPLIRRQLATDVPSTRRRVDSSHASPVDQFSEQPDRPGARPGGAWPLSQRSLKNVICSYSRMRCTRRSSTTASDTSIATLPGMERTLVFNGLSKAYAMTGWVYGAGPQPYVQQIEKVHSHSVTCNTSCRRPASWP